MPPADKPVPSPVFKIVVAYVVGGALWIILSDWVVDLIDLPPWLEPWEQTAKGLLFIVVTAFLLLAVLRRYWEASVQAEQRLRHGERLEAIGRLAGGIAHDFNNLLTAITGYSSLLLGRSDLPEAIRGDVAQISSAGDKAAVLTRQLLAYSRRQKLEMRAVNLNTVVEGLESMLRRVIRENIDMRVRRDPDLGWIEADSGQLEQVLMNLVVNASDAMPEGGKLTIETRNRRFTGDGVGGDGSSPPPGDYAGLVVSDTGPGMDEETAARAFDPFFTTKPEGQGTGLGLASVYGTVKQHRGTIWISTREGKGTTFHVFFPAVDEPAEERLRSAPREGPEPPQHRGRILLVEDQEAVRNATGRILEAYGYDVTEAGNADGAMAAVTEAGPMFDLLITDVVMPGGAGTRLAARLRHNDPELKVLYISGYAQQFAEGDQLQANEAFLTKPFSPGDLAKKVRELIAGDAS